MLHLGTPVPPSAEHQSTTNIPNQVTSSPPPLASSSHRHGQICATWKRNRQAILAAANATSQAAEAKAGDGAVEAATAAAAATATDGVPSGRRRVCAVGAGQGRDGGGGKIAKVYYHQLNEQKVSHVSLTCAQEEAFFQAQYQSLLCVRGWSRCFTRLTKLLGTCPGAANMYEVFFCLVYSISVVIHASWP